jgi:dTDP-4-dehydrorhamnose reductase
MAPRYLIIGASGFVGRRLYSVLGPARSVATYYNRPFEGGVLYDAGKMSLREAVLENRDRFSHAFILHGVTNIDACARDPEGTGRVNVGGTRRAIDELIEAGITPVFTSSDAVFDGSRGLWTEEDATHPVLTYGRQKVEVERHLERAGAPYLVVRPGKVVGTTPAPGDMLAEWVAKLESGAAIRCAHDQVLTPVAVDDLVAALIALAEGGHTGLFHAGGPRPVRRDEFLHALAEEIGRYRRITPRIARCSLNDFAFAEARPLDNSLSSRKLYQVLGREFEDYRATCRRLAESRYAAGTHTHKRHATQPQMNADTRK